MHERWEQVRRDLKATIRYPKVVRLYLEITRQRSLLAPFETPAALAEHLEKLRRNPSGNDLYMSIIDVCRVGAIRHADVAGRILWLGLWPLLSWLYWRQLKFWREEENDLASEIGRCLTTVLRGTDLTRAESVALTLVRNTERDLVERRQAQIADYNWDWSSVLLPWQACMTQMDDSEPARLADAAGVLRQQLGPDFELAVAAYKNGCDYEALGREFGLVDQEIRKRIRRAWRRVRKHMRKNRIE